MRTSLFGFLLCSLSAVAASAQTLTVDGSPSRVGLSVVRRVELDYYLLPPGRPIDFSADGPAWLRVYTRLWWPEGATGRQRYGLSLWQGDVERPIEFETELSGSSYGTGGHQVGRWRSFYIQVPAGENRYRLESASADVAVRFAFEGPRPWQPVEVAGGTTVNVATVSDTSAFVRVPTGVPVVFTAEGPCLVRIRVRLDYGPELVGAQNFVLGVSEGDRELATRNFRVAPSASAHYTGAAGVVPSTEKAVKFGLGEGRHRLRLVVNGTLARTVVLRIERHPTEKYE